MQCAQYLQETAKLTLNPFILGSLEEEKWKMKNTRVNEKIMKTQENEKGINEVGPNKNKNEKERHAESANIYGGRNKAGSDQNEIEK